MFLKNDKINWHSLEKEDLAIDNQRHGLETQAKFLILLTPHP